MKKELKDKVEKSIRDAVFFATAGDNDKMCNFKSMEFDELIQKLHKSSCEVSVEYDDNLAGEVSYSKISKISYNDRKRNVYFTFENKESIYFDTGKKVFYRKQNSMIPTEIDFKIL